MVGSMEARQACGVLRVGHLLERELVEVGVAEVVGAVHVGAAEGFGDDVDLGGAAVGAELRADCKSERMLRISTRTMPPEDGGGAVMTSKPW